MDTVIFTGKLSLERFKLERPLEYQRLVENNELDQYLVDPPKARHPAIIGVTYVPGFKCYLCPRPYRGQGPIAARRRSHKAASPPPAASRLVGGLPDNPIPKGAAPGLRWPRSRTAIR